MSDKPLAIKQLEELVRIPSRVSYGQLRLRRACLKCGFDSRRERFP
jgi:hypothetical protein